ncbi:hypothetical protein PflCFBP13517_26545 [Pseudomonas fluorescens]|nr:hypothetical protein PflCFBP13517_26545 [Pseudomonas fluorescens]
MMSEYAKEDVTKAVHRFVKDLWGVESGLLDPEDLKVIARMIKDVMACIERGDRRGALSYATAMLDKLYSIWRDDEEQDLSALIAKLSCYDVTLSLKFPHEMSALVTSYEEAAKQPGQAGRFSCDIKKLSSTSLDNNNELSVRDGDRVRFESETLSSLMVGPEVSDDKSSLVTLYEMIARESSEAGRVRTRDIKRLLSASAKNNKKLSVGDGDRIRSANEKLESILRGQRSGILRKKAAGIERSYEAAMRGGALEARRVVETNKKTVRYSDIRVLQDEFNALEKKATNLINSPTSVNAGEKESVAADLRKICDKLSELRNKLSMTNYEHDPRKKWVMSDLKQSIDRLEGSMS